MPCRISINTNTNTRNTKTNRQWYNSWAIEMTHRQREIGSWYKISPHAPTTHLSLSCNFKINREQSSVTKWSLKIQSKKRKDAAMNSPNTHYVSCIFLMRPECKENAKVQIYKRCPKKTHFQNAAGATVHWLNHHLPAPLVSGVWFFGRFLLRLSRIKRPQVTSTVKFSPLIALDYGYDFVLLVHFF